MVEELRGLGYDEVVSVHRYEDALRRAVIDLAATGDAPAPLISPVCPAVVNLIELKFPSLLDHLAPLASPWEAAQLALEDRAATFAVSCPSQRTALLAQRPTAQRDAVTAGAVREAVLPRLAARVQHAAGSPPRRRRPPAPTTARGDRRDARAGRARGGRGRPAPRRLGIEPYICDGGCFGTPLLTEDASVAAWRWDAVGGAAPGEAGSPARTRPYRARPGIRLDADMAVAIRSSPGWTRRPGRCPARTAACAARPPAPPSPKTSSWSAPRARLSVRRPGGGEHDMKLEDIARELGLTELTPESPAPRTPTSTAATRPTC